MFQHKGAPGFARVELTIPPRSLAGIANEEAEVMRQPF